MNTADEVAIKLDQIVNVSGQQNVAANTSFEMVYITPTEFSKILDNIEVSCR